MYVNVKSKQRGEIHFELHRTGQNKPNLWILNPCGRLSKVHWFQGTTSQVTLSIQWRIVLIYYWYLPGSWPSGPWGYENTPEHTAWHRSNTPARTFQMGDKVRRKTQLFRKKNNNQHRSQQECNVQSSITPMHDGKWRRYRRLLGKPVPSIWCRLAAPSGDDRRWCPTPSSATPMYMNLFRHTVKHCFMWTDTGQEEVWWRDCPISVITWGNNQLHVQWFLLLLV